LATEYQLSFNVKFDHPINVWVLELGGWFPIQLSTAEIILVDKNVKIALDKFAQKPDRADLLAERWWLLNLNSTRFKLHPLLCAYEGVNRMPPSFNEFKDALESSIEAFAAGLPLAQIVRHAPESLPELFENVRAYAEREEPGIQFLCDVAPLLVNRVGALSLRHTERNILDAARKRHLSLRSLPVLCALSCLYEPQNGAHPRIGRGVMKPTLSYGRENAYNAISDLRAIEFLAMAIGLGRERAGYCTRDKTLAAFWTYLRVSKATWGDDQFNMTFTPASELFPRLSEDELPRLLSRLA
jgi:hypothetical protein